MTYEHEDNTLKESAVQNALCSTYNSYYFMVGASFMCTSHLFLKAIQLV